MHDIYIYVYHRVTHKTFSLIYTYAPTYITHHTYTLHCHIYIQPHRHIEHNTYTHIHMTHNLSPPPCYSLHQELSHVLIENKYLHHHTYASSMFYSVKECISSLSYTFSLIKNFKKIQFFSIRIFTCFPSVTIFVNLGEILEHMSIWMSCGPAGKQRPSQRRPWPLPTFSRASKRICQVLVSSLSL